MSLRHLPLAAILLLVLGAAPAGAATVQLREPICDGAGCAAPELALAAAPGEVNRVEVRAEADGVVVADASLPLAAPEGCTQVSPEAVRCPTGLVDVDLGDRDDELRVLGPLARCDADAGDGADLVSGCPSARGGAGDDRLIGTDGPDELGGGDGADALEGLAGDDVLHDASAEPTAFAGGDGRDTATVRGRVTPVELDLASGTGSGGIVLAAIERLEGGDGADVLRGSAGDDLLEGGPGHDVLEGAGGADRLAGGPGFDRFDGGEGDDRLHADGLPIAALPVPGLDAQPEPVACGTGDDLVARQDGDLIAADCERLAHGVVPLPRRVRGGWAFIVPCRARGGCAGVLLTGGLVGGTGIRVVAPQRTTVRLRRGQGRVLVSRMRPYALGGAGLAVELRLGDGRRVQRWRLDVSSLGR